MTMKPMTNSFYDVVNRRPVLSVLVLSGLAGLVLGLSNTTWQAAVETGQVLAGIVKYPPDNPFYMYHIKLFTAITHISALLLRLTGSRIVACVIVSALLGMISFQALGLLIFAINRDVLMAFLGVTFIYFMNYVGKGVVYPIWLLGYPHTYGALGLSFAVLVLALIGAKVYSPALFCLGLAPCIHPSVGTYLLMVILLASLSQRDFARKIIRKYYPYFVAGMLIAVSLLVYQLYLARGLPAVDPEIKKRYVYAYIENWDSHRRKFYWDTTGAIHGNVWGILFCLYSVALAFFSLKFFKKDKPLSFVFKVVLISGILSLLLGFITQVPVRKLPLYLLLFMPGRYINLNNILLASCLFGILTYKHNRPYISNYNVFTILLVGSFFCKHEEAQAIIFAIALCWLACLTTSRRFWRQNKSLFAVRDHKVSYPALLLSFMALFFAINLPREKFIKHYVFHKHPFSYRMSEEFRLKVSDRKGLLLTTGGDFGYIVLETRRPILTDMAFPEFFLYAPESASIQANILKKIYGIDLLVPPPPQYRHRGIPAALYKDLWERRTVDQWKAIGREFSVTDILTSSDWKLVLPVVARDEKMILYEIQSPYP